MGAAGCHVSPGDTQNSHICAAQRKQHKGNREEVLPLTTPHTMNFTSGLAKEAKDFFTSSTNASKSMWWLRRFVVFTMRTHMAARGVATTAPKHRASAHCFVL